MIRPSLLLGCLLGVGCAAAPRTQSTAPVAHSEYTDCAASALPFDPTLDGGVPHPELARATRGPAAFLGFDEGTTESYIRATDDLQTNDFGDFYAQESISVRTGTRIR